MKDNMVIDFLNKYNNFAKVVSTSNKKKFDSIDSIYTVNSAIKSFIEMLEQGKKDEIDPSVINNLMYFTEEYLKRIENSTYKEKVIANLKDNLQKARILLEKNEKLLQR